MFLYIQEQLQFFVEWKKKQKAIKKKCFLHKTKKRKLFKNASNTIIDALHIRRFVSFKKRKIYNFSFLNFCSFQTDEKKVRDLF